MEMSWFYVYILKGKDMFEKQHSGKLYLPTDSDLINEQNEYLDLLYDFNNTRPGEIDKRNSLFKKVVVDQGKIVILNHLFMPIGVEQMYILETMFMPILS